MADKPSKTSGPVLRFRKTDDLTCGEGEVEDLLSDGESTETEPVKKVKRAKRDAKRPGSSRRA